MYYLINRTTRGVKALEISVNLSKFTVKESETVNFGGLKHGE